MNNNSGHAVDAADALARKAQQLPESLQFALINVLPNIVNGAFWGFTSTSECMKFADSLKQDKHIMLRKLNGGQNVLIEINPDYLVKAARILNAQLITNDDVAEMQRGMAEGAAAFEKFLISKSDGKFASAVGIYCINDSASITLKGKPYPAFRVDIATAVNLMTKWGWQFVVGGKRVAPNVASGNSVALFNAMSLSPTNTGIFVNIACTYSKEQIKSLKQQYNM